jgi:hypothetical protein
VNTGEDVESLRKLGEAANSSLLSVKKAVNRLYFLLTEDLFDIGT